jgi:hypothetical protein
MGELDIVLQPSKDVFDALKELDKCPSTTANSRSSLKFSDVAMNRERESMGMGR